MIVGLGTDVISIERIENVHRKFKAHFEQKILNQSELLHLSQQKDRARFIAKRFAVKEAAAKALGTGFRKGISWHDISVSHDDLGKPILVLTDRAKLEFDRLGATNAWVSLSDEKHYVVATVILER